MSRRGNAQAIELSNQTSSIANRAMELGLEQVGATGFEPPGPIKSPVEIDVTAAGLRSARAKLGECECSDESDRTSDDPCGENERGRVNALSNDCRVEKDSGADDSADNDHRRIEHTETADVAARRVCADINSDLVIANSGCGGLHHDFVKRSPEQKPDSRPYSVFYGQSGAIYRSAANANRWTKMTQRLFSLVLAGVALGSLAIVGCNDRSSTAPETALESAPAGVVVSNVVTITGSAGSLRTYAAATSEPVAYISAAPGTFPGIPQVLIRNETRGGDVESIVLSNGGFDPVVVPAKEGDLVLLTPVAATGISGTPVSIKVPPRRPPSVVRTTPSHGRTDVALNVQISVVFTEPVDVSSVTSETISLSRGGVPVAGALTLANDRLSAELIPAQGLEAGTTYSLEVKGIRDPDGDVMVGEDVGTFTTENSPATSNPTPVTPPPSGLRGTLAFVSTRDGVAHIYVSNADGSAIRRLTDLTQAEFTPAWSRDGEMLAFSTADNLYVVRKDGTGLTKLPFAGAWPSWSPDGKRLIATVGDRIQIIPLNGSAATDVDIKFSTGESNPWRSWGASWSPDGNRIAFSAWTEDWGDVQYAFIADVDGSNVRPFVGSVQGRLWHECGPVWSPDGSQIALLGGVFGGIAYGGDGSPTGIWAVGIVDPKTGNVSTIATTGTTCWDGPATSLSGVAWSPDATMLAVTKRDPPDSGQASTNKKSIVIVDIASKAARIVIPDAYDPAWSQLD